jgi:hypothetical protein
MKEPVSLAAARTTSLGSAHLSRPDDDRLALLEGELRSLAATLERVASELAAVRSLSVGVDGAVAGLRADIQRGFTDLRNGLRHYTIRMQETMRR